MRQFVLDSFALLAFFLREPRGARVRELLREASQGNVRLSLSTINLAEVMYRLERAWGEDRAMEILALIEGYPIDIVPIDRSLALAAARLKARHPISLADCIAVALAQRLNAALVTADPDFQQLQRVVSIEWLNTSP
jgi:ribonuclease VapC